MPIKIMVRPTSETVVVDVEIQHQRHRVRCVRKIDNQLNVPTIPTPAFSHLYCLEFACCSKKVSELVNHPVVVLFGSRMSGTST
jgi:hypothetical protein